MAKKIKSFDLGKYQSKKEKPEKVKAEKPEKIKKEKPIRVKQKKAIKLGQTDTAPVAEKKHKRGKKLDLGSSARSTGKNTAIDLSGAENKKSRKGLIIGICVGAAVLLAAAAVIVFVFVIPKVKSNGMLIERIEITQAPEKLTYLIGEEANYTGLRVTVTRKNGETFVVRADQCQFSGFDTSRDYKFLDVTVSYEGVTDTFTIEVLERGRTLKSIRLDPMPKTQYKVDEWLDTSGAVLVREYWDADDVCTNLPKTSVYGWEKVWGKGPGTYTLTVKYAENGVLCTFDFQITVE